MVADIEQGVCEGNYLNVAPNEPTPGKNCGRYDPTIYGGLFAFGGVLLGVGIPMIVIGAKKEPVGTARVAPWISPQAGGRSLRLDT